MKRFVAMTGPVFEEVDKERSRIKVYLEEEDYNLLEEKADEAGCSPAKLLSWILSDWSRESID